MNRSLCYLDLLCSAERYVYIPSSCNGEFYVHGYGGSPARSAVKMFSLSATFQKLD